MVGRLRKTVSVSIKTRQKDLEYDRQCKWPRSETDSWTDLVTNETLVENFSQPKTTPFFFSKAIVIKAGAICEFPYDNSLQRILVLTCLSMKKSYSALIFSFPRCFLFSRFLKDTFKTQQTLGRVKIFALRPDKEKDDTSKNIRKNLLSAICFKKSEWNKVFTLA